MNIKEEEAALEAILFAEGDSVETSRLAEAIGQDVKTTENLLQDMQENYQDETHGIELYRLDDAWQLCTKKDYYKYLIRIVSKPRKNTLTDVMMETLSIIAYKQPITRLEIEKIRGVKSDHAINRLIEWDLICELGRLDAPGKPILFGTTEEFLRQFGLHSLDELPQIESVKKEDFKAEAEKEIDEEK